MISAEVIADSVSPVGIRLTTVKCVYPWFIHGEVMTHRVFSRNASSNRAVPTSKLLAEARDPKLRAMPSFSVINAPGMQGGRPTTEIERNRFAEYWHAAAMRTADIAEGLAQIGAAKQDVNRLLMPFTHARVLITATDWRNFFGLRIHKDAQPEARELAIAIWKAQGNSAPKLLQPGEWHLPYVTAEELAEKDWSDDPISYHLKVSVARCARVSYESFETGRRSTIEEDLRLYERLVGSQPMHASPTEHQATPDQYVYDNEGNLLYDRYGVRIWEQPYKHGNLRGWRQYRKMLPGEAEAPFSDDVVSP